MSEAPARIQYEFAEFRLDPQHRLRLAAVDGRPIPLSPKAFDTLLHLVEARGELLDKTTLMKAIWPNIVVEENNLNKNISELRKVLGEVARVPGLKVPARTSSFAYKGRNLDIGQIARDLEVGVVLEPFELTIHSNNQRGRAISIGVTLGVAETLALAFCGKPRSL